MSSLYSQINLHVHFTPFTRIINLSSITDVVFVMSHEGKCP